jgi:tRNA (adenine22-N1)-methyltransferase
MEVPRLSRALPVRLAAVFRQVLPGLPVADIGTGHGRLPIALRESGRAPLVIATESVPAPLSEAAQNVRTAGVTGVILRVGWGLDAVQPGEVEQLCLAGMGGETIISILRRAPWTKGHVTLLLQPQSKLSELCVWLAANHYALCGAVLVEDAGRLYAVLSVQGAAEPQVMLFVEDMLLRNRDPLLPRWLDEHISSLTKAAAGLSQAKEKTGADGVREILERFIRAKEETKTWRQSEK